MKNIRILVPTDFSPCAFNALEYAIHFSKYIKGEIILIHSIVYNDSTFINESDREEENTRRYNEADNRMKDLVDIIKSKDENIPLIIKLEGGTPLPSIETILESEEVDYVIMGTQGASGIKAALFGSYTSNLMKHASCPVLAIPPTAKFHNLSHILCATEMHLSELPAILNLLKLGNVFNSKITFQNISDDEVKQETDLKLFKEKIKSLTNYDHIVYELEKSKDVIETIEKSACEGHYDLIATLGRHRNFLDKLMNISVSRRLCLHTSVPVLSFPHSDF